MHLKIPFILFFSIIFLQACKEKNEDERKYPPNYCFVTEIVATSRYTTCNVQFEDIVNKFTYIGNESSFYTLGKPCNRSVFSIRYTNSKHDHNEPDYTFMLKMDYMNKEDFFRPDSLKISSFSLREEKLTGGGEETYQDVDITLVWLEVALNGNRYSGKGKIIINKDIPHSSFAGFKYPAQEIPFKFN